jgi:sugar transferase (PEP-CTERM/EpsH1 system associated)
MKILWVKAGGLVPTDTGGKIRSYNILRELARHHSVTLFSFYASHPNDIHPELKSIFQRVVCLPLDLPAPKSFGEFLDYGIHLFSLDPYNITKFCRPQVRRELHHLLELETYDVIVCDFLVPAGVIPWDSSCPKVLFTHNVEAIIWRRHYEVARNPFWKALSWREWKTMDSAERKYLQRADHVLAVSDNDRDEFLKFLDPSRISVIPTGVDVDYFKPIPEREASDSLVFTGSMDWLPNEDGIFYFVKEILPLIRQQVPGVSLCVVGRKPSRRLQELALAEAPIDITRWVDDVRPYLARGAVCIVPLRIGGGTRLKIFEAMAMAKPIVSTSIGAEGLPVRNAEHLLLADEPKKFADSVISLLRDSDRRKQMGLAARKLVEENYSWTQVANMFAAVLTNVVSRSRLPNSSGSVTLC